MATSEAGRIAAYVIRSIEEKPACTTSATAVTWPGLALTHGLSNFWGVRMQTPRRTRTSRPSGHWRTRYRSCRS